MPYGMRRKRLVGKKKYIRTAGRRIFLKLSAYTVSCIGVVCLLMSACLLWDDALNIPLPPALTDRAWFIPFGLFGAISLWFTRVLFKRVQEIRPVALITKHTAKRLPYVETLVRGSDAPPSQQQAELLRAVGKGQATPSEQLLRATQGQEQDV
jgi:hypothetical protein